MTNWPQLSIDVERDYNCCFGCGRDNPIGLKLSFQWDGKTAKAVWYSPGMVTEIGQDGKPFAMWMWEKYGVDFAKEDGKWKIWHIHMYTDFAVPPGKSWTDPEAKSSFSFGDTVERPPEMNLDVEITTYQEWSPTTVPQLLPRLPEPYETFSDTFSYGPE